MEDDRVLPDITLESAGGPTSGTFYELWCGSSFSHSCGASCSEGLASDMRAEVVVQASEEP